MDKKCCIFDMDGTLVDSMGYWKQLGREFLAGQGIRDGVEEVLERCKTMTMVETAAQMIQAFGLEGTPEELAAQINGVMDEHYRSDIPLRPGAADYLTALKERGCKLCVATATEEGLARMCMERLGVAGQLEFILSCETLGKGKGEPDIFLEAARRLGVEPWETAVFEDALIAVRTAKSIGCYTVGIYDENGAADWPVLAKLADESILGWNQML